MKILRNKCNLIFSGSLVVPLLLLILAFLAQGCGPRPTDPAAQPTRTPLPASPSSTPPSAPTATFQLLDIGTVYTVVGLSADETLPIYWEPSPSAEISGNIPPGGKSIRTTGLETLADGITWLQVVYIGSAGWVDSSYLARQYGDIPEEIVKLAQSAAEDLMVADYYHLSSIIHPNLCLRFSPYPYLLDSDQTFCPEDMAGLLGSDTLFTWGRYDGSGEPIKLSFDDYHQRFVYDQDFFQPEIVGLNQEVSSGNAINNIPDVYPDGIVVEYHFPGFDPKYSGMDWRSLRLVFVQEKGGWFLVALVHGEWTI